MEMPLATVFINIAATGIDSIAAYNIAINQQCDIVSLLNNFVLYVVDSCKVKVLQLQRI